MNSPYDTIRRLVLTFALSAFSIPVTLAAPYFDNFDSTVNLTTFGNVTLSVEGNTLTASRSAGDVDSGFNWRPNGNGLFSLNANDEQFTFSLNAVAPDGGGQYNIAGLFFDSGGNFIDELSVQNDTGATGFFTYNMAEIGAGFPGAEQWFPRVRITTPSAGFQYRDFGAVPEPSTYALLGFAGLAAAILWRRKRS